MFTVHADTTCTPAAVIDCLDVADWFHNFTLTVTRELWSVYVINPCPSGYRWDAESAECVLDTCPIGYHWEVTVQDCVKDTETNCPTGYVYDTAKGYCVAEKRQTLQTDGQKFPWIPVIVGVGASAAVGVCGYYLYKRSKKRKTPSFTPQTSSYTPQNTRLMQ